MSHANASTTHDIAREIVRTHDKHGCVLAVHVEQLRAALSSPPVLPAAAWVHILRFDGNVIDNAVTFQEATPFSGSTRTGYSHEKRPLYAAPQASAPALDDARDAVRIELTSEQVQALYLCLLHDRPRPAFGWMEKPLTDIQALLEPIHGRLHVKEFPF